MRVGDILIPETCDRHEAFEGTCGKFTLFPPRRCSYTYVCTARLDYLGLRKFILQINFSVKFLCNTLWKWLFLFQVFFSSFQSTLEHIFNKCANVQRTLEIPFIFKSFLFVSVTVYEVQYLWTNYEPLPLFSSL